MLIMHLTKDCYLQALTLDAGKDNVVTIFGFPNTEKSQAIILQEFGKCGDIVRFHRHTQCNWMHIQYAVSHHSKYSDCYICCLWGHMCFYLIFAAQLLQTHTDIGRNFQNKYEAQRALLKNGLILSASIMIGVQPLAQQHLHLFDVDSERDTILQIPKVSDKQQQLTEKVNPQMLCCVRIGLMTSTAAAIHMMWSAPKGALRVCRTCSFPCHQKGAGPR